MVSGSGKKQKTEGKYWLDKGKREEKNWRYNYATQD